MAETSERDFLDGRMSLPESGRLKVWESVDRILSHGPLSANPTATTGLALGFVQSGKTTSMTALVAAGADAGYRIIIAFLGSTNLLLDQNQKRMDESIGFTWRNDYRWVMEPSPSGTTKSRRIDQWLELDRTVFIPVLKHAGRINKLAEVLSGLKSHGVPTLVIDDEADQASLNVSPTSSSISKTYEAISNVRAAAPNNLYVQYTATPYAPLLLDPLDHLKPQFVEFLEPGEGYTGGKEFFVDNAETVIRIIPGLEEQQNTAPMDLPKSLVNALASFLVGSALLLAVDPDAPPVSMLVHSTHKNDIQARYHHLIERQLRDWRDLLRESKGFSDLPQAFSDERKKLVKAGAMDIADEDLFAKLLFVIRQVLPWLVNSTEAVNAVEWNLSPVHILVGGNKLDRGFTVEGLTVTYMNRKPSPQIDTLEQRARAFGYRGDLLPYCQFFASKRTVKVLKDVVYTEFDLRLKLFEHLEDGGSVATWAKEVGLLLPEGTKPTRNNVIENLSDDPVGWRSLRTPNLDDASIAHNAGLVKKLGLLDASDRRFGNKDIRTLELPLSEVIQNLISQWKGPSHSADWRYDSILDTLTRHPRPDDYVPVMLMEEPKGTPRVRMWREEIGFVNLFQGRSLHDGPGSYPGDRNVYGLDEDQDKIVVQVHRVVRRDQDDPNNLFTLAIHIGERKIVRRTDA